MRTLSLRNRENHSPFYSFASFYTRKQVSWQTEVFPPHLNAFQPKLEQQGPPENSPCLAFGPLSHLPCFQIVSWLATVYSLAILPSEDLPFPTWSKYRSPWATTAHRNVSGVSSHKRHFRTHCRTPTICTQVHTVWTGLCIGAKGDFTSSTKLDTCTSVTLS